MSIESCLLNVIKNIDSHVSQFKLSNEDAQKVYVQLGKIAFEISDAVHWYSEKKVIKANEVLSKLPEEVQKILITQVWERSGSPAYSNQLQVFNSSARKIEVLQFYSDIFFFKAIPHWHNLYKQARESLENKKTEFTQNVANSTPLAAAIRTGKIELVAAAMENGVDLDAIEPLSGMTPLILACKLGHAQIVNLLLQSGANVEKPMANNLRPLFVACLYNFKDCVQSLISHGANVNATGGEHEETALHAAAIRGYPEVMSELLKASNLDINARTKNVDTTFSINQTALNFAVAGNRVECVRLLVEKGATIKNAEGHLLLNYAQKKQYIEVAQILLEGGAPMFFDPNTNLWLEQNTLQ